MQNIESPLCCGKPRKTRYCPDCGKELFGEGPLWELLSQTQMTARRFENEYKRLSDYPDDQMNNYRSKMLDSSKRNMDKWYRWSKALREVLESE